MAEQFTFTNAQGLALHGRLDAPESPTSYALFAHCFTCGKDFKCATRIVNILNARGIAVFRFDFTGIGGSEGNFADTNFSTNVSDLLLAVEYMRNYMHAPSLMIGHSLGGTATLVAAGQVDECQAVAVIGSPSRADNVVKQFARNLQEIERDGQADVMLAGRKFTIKKQFLDDVRNQHVLHHVNQLKRALLILHSPIDETVSIAHAGDIFAAARHPKSYVSLDEADHLLFKPGSAEYVGEIIATFSSQYLPVLPFSA